MDEREQETKKLLNNFYEDLKLEDQSELLKRLYDASDDDIRQTKKRRQDTAMSQTRFIPWLSCCLNLRNICSHNGRLYARGFAYTPAMPTEFNRFQNEKKLWAQVLSVRFLYPDDMDWTMTLLPQMKSLFDDYRRQWGNTAHEKLLNAFGFPPDWPDWLQKW